MKSIKAKKKTLQKKLNKRIQVHSVQEENNEKFLLRAIRKGEEELQRKVGKCFEKLLQNKKKRINKLEYDPLITETVEDHGEIQTHYYHHIIYATHSLRDLINAFKEKEEKIPLSDILYYSKKLLSFLAFLEDNEICSNTLLPEHILLGGNHESKQEDIYIAETILIKDISITMIFENRPSSIEKQLLKKYSSPDFHEKIIMAYQREIESDSPNIEQFNNQTNQKILFKSQFFSLGLILLELGLLRTPQHKYDPELQKELNSMVYEFQEKYNFDMEKDNSHQAFGTLIKIIKKLLSYEEEKKPFTFSKAESLLNDVMMTKEQKLKSRLASKGYGIN